MKHIIILILLTLSLVSCGTDNKNEKSIIEGKASNLEDLNLLSE